MANIDKTAKCLRCGRLIERYAGVPGSKFMTPYWRAAEADYEAHPHLIEPDPDTIQAVQS